MEKRMTEANKILIVDDEIPILFAMAEYLSSHNYQVDSAQEIAEAEELLAKNPSLIPKPANPAPGALSLTTPILNVTNAVPSTNVIVLTNPASSTVTTSSNASKP